MASSATSTAAAKAPARRHAAPSRRPSLRLVPARVTRAGKNGHLLEVLAISLVVGALLAVVIGQAVLANDQIRSAALQHDLTLEQASHRQEELVVAQLETPPRIVATATGKLGMVHAQVVELPYVSLTTPVATPNVTAAPPPPVTTTTVPSATTTTTSSTTTPSTTPASGSASTSASTPATTPTTTPATSQ